GHCHSKRLHSRGRSGSAPGVEPGAEKLRGSSALPDADTRTGVSFPSSSCFPQRRRPSLFFERSRALITLMRARERSDPAIASLALLLVKRNPTLVFCFS